MESQLTSILSSKAIIRPFGSATGKNFVKKKDSKAFLYSLGKFLLHKFKEICYIYIKKIDFIKILL